jgi:glucose/mannose transport system permease protein
MRNLGFENFHLRLAGPERLRHLLRGDRRGVAGLGLHHGAVPWPGCARINTDIVNAAKIDGAGTWQTYRYVILPELRPMFLTAFVVQAHLAIKSYDLVVALTKGGPGFATELPSTFMYSTTFTRNEMGLGAASAVIMLCTIAAVVVPYLYSEIRNERRSA